MKKFTCIVVELTGRGPSGCALKTENRLLLVVGKRKFGEAGDCWKAGEKREQRPNFKLAPKVVNTSH